MECLHTTGFHRRLRTSGVPTFRRWWRWAKISYSLQLHNVGGWSAWWPFCQACIGRIGISASVYFTLFGSLELMYSVQNSATRNASSQLKLLQRHTSLRPSHFLYVTDDAEGRPLLSTPLTPISKSLTQAVCGYLLDSMFWVHRIEIRARTSCLCPRLQKGRHFPSVALALQNLPPCGGTTYQSMTAVCFTGIE